MGYAECWALQRSLFDRMLASKAGRADGRDGAAEQDVSDQTAPEQAGTLLLVEHPPVYTLGKSGREANLLVDEERLRAMGADLFRIDRGGDITFHGRGQIVGYPILDLERLGIGLRDYIDRLEEAVICVAADYGIEAGRIAGAAGAQVVRHRGAIVAIRDDARFRPEREHRSAILRLHKPLRIHRSRRDEHRARNGRGGRHGGGEGAVSETIKREIEC